MTHPSALPLSPRARSGLLAGLAVLCAFALAVPAFTGIGHPAASPAAPRSHRTFAPLADSPESIASEAVAQMQAIAQGSVSGLQEAGAAAVAEYEAAGAEATQAVVAAQGEGQQQVSTVSAPPSSLQQPPPGTDVGNVTASPQASSVPGYSIQASESHSGSFVLGPVAADVTPYEGSDSGVKARVAFNLPMTGNAAIDGEGAALLSLYVEVKGGVRDTGNSTNDKAEESGAEAVWDDSTFGQVTAGGEGATWEAAPDKSGAQAATEHATSLIGKANATLSSVLSGVKANIALQANLTAEVQAEIDATLEAQEQAEAAVDAEAEARVDATFAASAQAEAEAHAAAERHLEVVKQAHLAASQKVHAEATQQVELVAAAAAQAQESLRGQAAAALDAGARAVQQIHAAAEAAVQALARAPGTNNTDAGGRAQAILNAAAAAEAAAQAKANATAKALLAQAAAVGAQVDVKVKAILTMEAKAEADLDAKAQVAAKVTARAEAYTVAKIRANAQAQAQAHLRAAAAAKFKLEASAKAHIRVVLKAALGLTAAAQVSFDGSKDLGNQVGLHTQAEATKDIQYVREVSKDYDHSNQVGHNESAKYWKGVADNLDLQKDAVLAVAYDIGQDVDYGVKLLLVTQHELELLGQQYL